MRLDALFDLFRGNIFSLASHPLRMLGSDITDLCVAPVWMHSASHSILGLEASEQADCDCAGERFRFKDWSLLKKLGPFCDGHVKICRLNGTKGCLIFEWVPKKMVVSECWQREIKLIVKRLELVWIQCSLRVFVRRAFSFKMRQPFVPFNQNMSVNVQVFFRQEFP